MKELTDEQLRVAVAEYRGAKWVHDDTHKVQCLTFESRPRCGPQRWELEDGRILNWDIPNYPASLDACATFEHGLTPNDFQIYEDALNGICDTEGTPRICATARQRCLAYLMTFAPERLKG